MSATDLLFELLSYYKSRGFRILINQEFVWKFGNNLVAFFFSPFLLADNIYRENFVS